MKTGAEGARKKWVFDDPKKQKKKKKSRFSTFEIEKYSNNNPPFSKRDFRQHFAPEGGGC